MDFTLSDIRGHPPSVSFRFWLPSTLYSASVTMASPVQLPLTSAFRFKRGRAFHEIETWILPVFPASGFELPCIRHINCDYCRLGILLPPRHRLLFRRFYLVELIPCRLHLRKWSAHQPRFNANNRHLTAEGGPPPVPVRLDRVSFSMERTINWKPSDLRNSGGAARTMETWVKTSGMDKALMSWAGCC